MPTFQEYAQYYDLLYQDKEYSKEASFISETLRTASPAGKTLLDLGCGTGRHCLELETLGWETWGVDLSEQMIRQAQAAATKQRLPQSRFAVGDIRTIRLGKRYDCVTALFHVASYQTTYADMASLLRTARAHLKPGGLFLFDYWYGPAVLTDKPHRRCKKIENNHTRMTRVAVPVMHLDKNVVDVNYTIELSNIENKSKTTFHEKHSMRYWFYPELEYILTENGFSPLITSEWMKKNTTPKFDSWNVFSLLKAT